MKKIIAYSLILFLYVGLNAQDNNQQKVELLKGLNVCARIINHRQENVATVLSKEYANKIDVGFDSVGRHIFDAFLKNLANLGRLVVSGLATEISAGVFEEIHVPK